MPIPTDGLRPRRALSIQQRLYLLVLLAVLPALAVQLVSGVQAYREREKAVRNEALRLAEFTSGELDRIIQANRALLTAMANLRSVREHDGQLCSSYAAKLIANYPEFVQISATDRDGHLFCSSFSPGPDGLSGADRDFADRFFFRQAKAAGTFTISTFQVGSVSKKPELPLVLPLRDSDGRFAGVVFSTLDLNWAARHFATRTLPDGTSITVLDRDGTIVMRTPGASDAIGSPARKDFRWLLDAPRSGTGVGSGRDGVERLFGYVPLNDPPEGLVVTVGIGTDAAMGPVRAIAVRDTALLIAALVLALVAASVGGRRFIERPLSTLARTAERWSAGDLSARARLTDRTSEIGRLAVSFDHMADVIAARDQELTDAIADLDAALQQKTLLTAELAHRVKNTLAIVQGMAQITLRGSQSLPEAAALFKERLMALSHAHDILTNESWQGADLRQIVVSITAPHVDPMSNRINASGPPVRLASAQAVALAMALHELCTNAVKYGALSNEAGRIDIVWNLNGRNGMRLQWRESGGPPVAPDPKRGFGTRFIEASFRADPNQSVRLEFAPAGVVCIIELPFATASRDDLLTEIGSGGPDPSPG